MLGIWGKLLYKSYKIAKRAYNTEIIRKIRTNSVLLLDKPGGPAYTEMIFI